MNKILLGTLFFSLVTPQAQAFRYPLSHESKHFVVMIAAIGGTLGAALGSALYADAQKNNTGKSDWWTKIKDVSSYIVLPTIAGAALFGGVSYFFTAENTLNWAQKNLIGIEHDSSFNAAMVTNNLNVIKAENFKDKFPTMKTFNKLEKIYDSLSNIKENLINVVKSGISPIASIADKLVDKINHYQMVLRALLIRLKNDPSFVQEQLIKMQNKLVEAQADIAISQRRLADAALIKAMQPQQPPMIIMHPK